MGKAPFYEIYFIFFYLKSCIRFKEDDLALQIHYKRAKFIRLIKITKPFFRTTAKPSCL